MHQRGSNLEQIEDLLAQVQLEVGVVGARHVVDEDQAVPLGLKAVDNQGTRQSKNGSHKHRSFWNKLNPLFNLLTFPQPDPAGRRAPEAPHGCPSCSGDEVLRCRGQWRPLKGPAHSAADQQQQQKRFLFNKQAVHCVSSIIFLHFFSNSGSPRLPKQTFRRLPVKTWRHFLDFVSSVVRKRLKKWREAVQKWRTHNQPQGGTSHLSLPASHPAEKQSYQQLGGRSVLLSAVVISLPLRLCPPSWRQCVLLHLDDSGDQGMRQPPPPTLLTKNEGRVLRRGRIKIPQTGYEGCRWGNRMPTSGWRMCSTNATVACQRVGGGGGRGGNAGGWGAVNPKLCYLYQVVILFEQNKRGTVSRNYF